MVRNFSIGEVGQSVLLTTNGAMQMINNIISIAIVLIPAFNVFRTGKFKVNFFISWGLMFLFTLYTHGISPGSFAILMLGWLYPLIFCGIAYYIKIFSLKTDSIKSDSSSVKK